MPLMQIAFFAVLLMSIGYAFFFGGRTGKAGAIIFLCASILTMIVERMEWAVPNATGPFYGVLSVDVACMFALFALTLRSHRFWPIWALGFQVACVSSHLAMMFVPQIVPRVYQMTAGFWSIPILIVMVAGTYLDRRKNKKSGISPASES